MTSGGVLLISFSWAVGLGLGDLWGRSFGSPWGHPGELLRNAKSTPGDLQVVEWPALEGSALIMLD